MSGGRKSFLLLEIMSCAKSGFMNPFLCGAVDSDLLFSGLGPCTYMNGWMIENKYVLQ